MRRRGHAACWLAVLALALALALASAAPAARYRISDAEIPVLGDVWIKDPALDALLAEAAGPEGLVLFQSDSLRLESTRAAQASVDLLLNLAESIRAINRSKNHVIFSRTQLFHAYVGQASYRSYLDASPGGSKIRRILRHAMNVVARGHDALFIASDHVMTRDPVPLLRARDYNVGLPEDLSSRVFFAKSDPKTVELLLQVYRNVPEEQEADERGPDPAAPEYVDLASVVQAVQADQSLSASYRFHAFSRSEFPAALPPYDDVGLVSTAYAGKWVAYDRDASWGAEGEDAALREALSIGVALDRAEIRFPSLFLNVALDRAVILPRFGCAHAPDYVPGFWPEECHASALYDGDALAEFSSEMLVEAILPRERFAPEALRARLTPLPHPVPYRGFPPLALEALRVHVAPNGTNTLSVTLKKPISDGESIHYFREFELDQIFHFKTMRAYFSRWENKKREKKYRAAVDAFLKRRAAPARGQ
eukprot:tig00020902_g15028.t1